MDGLSTASSVFAVVSIGIQLAENVRSLVEFWSAVQDAPEHISTIFRDLQSLSSLLEDSQNIDKVHTHHVDVEGALDDCHKKISVLRDRLQGPLTDFRSQKKIIRKWSAFKVTLRQKEISSLQDAIEKAKATLFFARFISLEHLSRTQLELISRKLDEPIQLSLPYGQGQIINMRIPRRSNESAETQDTVLLQAGGSVSTYINNQTLVQSGCLHSSRMWESANSDAMERADAAINPEVHTYLDPYSLEKFVVAKSRGISQITGFTSFMQRKPSKEKPGHTYRNYVYVFHPPRALNMLGVSHGIQIISSDTLGSVYTLQPFRAVAEDALIFVFCREGNLAGVKTLFSLGQASPWDRDPEGRTPLWVAAYWLRVDIVELLLNEGADRHAFDWRHHWEPATAAAHSHYLEVNRQIPILRMLIGNADSHEDVYPLGHIMRNYRPGRIMAMPQAYRNESVRQAIVELIPGVFSNKHYIAGVMWDGLVFQYNSKFLRSALDKLACFLDDKPMDFDVQPVINMAIRGRMLTIDHDLVKMIIIKTRNLHITGTTLLAMLQPGSFFAWRDILVELGFNIHEFVRRELQEETLTSAGWNEESLMQLFTATPVAMGIPHRYLEDEVVCDRCGSRSSRGLLGYTVDLAWRVQLYELRQGLPNKSVQPYEKISSILPHRIVCLDNCRDRLCVAWLFENSPLEEAVFPPYLGPWKPQVQSPIQGPRISEVDEKTDECPSQNIPGAFKD